MSCRRFGFLRSLAAVFALSFALIRPAAATDYTDIWWNPSESGWGVNIAQNGNFIFATFFVYAPGNAPTWVTGQLSLAVDGNFTGRYARRLDHRTPRRHSIRRR